MFPMLSGSAISAADTPSGISPDAAEGY